MKNLMQIILKDQAIINFQAKVKKTNDTFIKVYELQEANDPIFLEIENNQINTLLELSKVSPFVLLYFDEKLDFSGASFSLNKNKSPFTISNESKKILFLQSPISFQLKDVLSLTIKS
jgi:hypothetical protein